MPFQAPVRIVQKRAWDPRLATSRASLHERVGGCRVASWKLLPDQAAILCTWVNMEITPKLAIQHPNDCMSSSVRTRCEENSLVYRYLGTTGTCLGNELVPRFLNICYYRYIPLVSAGIATFFYYLLSSLYSSSIYWSSYFLLLASTIAIFL
ncbi:hypothetical protein GGI35DRAFT_412262 [Trichoderma velutinum]